MLSREIVFLSDFKGPGPVFVVLRNLNIPLLHVGFRQSFLIVGFPIRAFAVIAAHSIKTL